MKHTYCCKILFLILLTSLVLTVLALTQVSFAENAKTDYDFSGVYLTRDLVRIKEGGSFTLTLRKINAGDSTPVFTSADPTVATVDADGTVQAVSLGKTTVTVTLGDYSDSVSVIVTELDPAHEEYAHTAELLRDFLDLRFGMFLHFNSSTYEFASIGGDWAGENRTSTFNPKSWNPSQMDCREWAKAAKSAGMTFAVLTTKHHDGFNLWDSAYTDYDIGSATYKNDVIKEFTDACREEGIKPALYFSMLDIKHRITSSSCTPTDIEFIKAQLTELLTNYGEIPFLIFDAWNAWWGGPNYSLLPYEEIVNLVHSLQPNCLVINISCEANNVRSQVAMFESAAGQNVPDWFDNVNISCNTPTSHWFWCTKYQTETFKTADWVLNENVNKFRDSDTVFILNVSPNQQGVLIPKYKALLSEIGERYQKAEDVEALPQRYLADYDYTNNLLFHKRVWANTADGNAIADRAVDGFCDIDNSHETAYKSTQSMACFAGDIGYTASLGTCYVHIAKDMPAASLENTYLFLLAEDPGARTTYLKLNKGDYIKKIKLTDCENIENCYKIDLSGSEARYIAIALEKSGTLSLSEVVLTKETPATDSAYSLRETFGTLSVTKGSDIQLPEHAVFVTENGSLVKETINWQREASDLEKAGIVSVKGVSTSGCEVSIRLEITSAGNYIEVPSVSVQASSMWSQAESLGWAHSRNLIDKSGLTLNASNILYSTHDNPYNGTTMWHSLEGNTTGWLIFDFGKVTTLTNALIWNHNQLDEPDRGVKSMDIYYTAKENPTDSDWILVGNYQLTKANAVAAQTATDLVSLGKLEARKIKFDIKQNYGDPSVVGLSEVIFFASSLGSTLDVTSATTAIGEFELLNSFDYDATAFAKAKAAYLALKTAIPTETSQAKLDTLVNALNAELQKTKATYQKKTPKALSDFLIRVKVGESLPETLSVSFTNSAAQTLPVTWDAVPSEKMSTVGCFSLRGILTDTTYSVSATVIIEGVSTKSLRTLITSYEALDTARYTKDSVNTLKNALTAAKAVLAKENPTEEEVSTAKSNLTAAKYALAVSYASAVVTPPVTTAPDDTTVSPEETTAPITTNTPSTTDTPTTTDTPVKGDNDSSYGWVFILLGILAALGAGVLLTFVLLKKKG